MNEILLKEYLRRMWDVKDRQSWIQASPEEEARIRQAVWEGLLDDYRVVEGNFPPAP